MLSNYSDTGAVNPPHIVKKFWNELIHDRGFGKALFLNVLSMSTGDNGAFTYVNLYVTCIVIYIIFVTFRIP